LTFTFVQVVLYAAVVCSNLKREENSMWLAGPKIRVRKIISTV